MIYLELMHYLVIAGAAAVANDCNIVLEIELGVYLVLILVMVIE